MKMNPWTFQGSHPAGVLSLVCLRAPGLVGGPCESFSSPPPTWLRFLKSKITGLEGWVFPWAYGEARQDSACFNGWVGERWWKFLPFTLALTHLLVELWFWLSFLRSAFLSLSTILPGGNYGIAWAKMNYPRFCLLDFYYSKTYIISNT